MSGAARTLLPKPVSQAEGPLAALRIADPARRRQLERALGEAMLASEADADVLVIELAPAGIVIAGWTT